MQDKRVNYSKTELDLKFQNVIDQVTLAIKPLHDDVIETKGLAKDNNHRLSKLEQWRSFMTGGMTILTMFVVPILLYILTKGI